MTVDVVPATAGTLSDRIPERAPRVGVAAGAHIVVQQTIAPHQAQLSDGHVSWQRGGQIGRCGSAARHSTYVGPVDLGGGFRRGLGSRGQGAVLCRIKPAGPATAGRACGQLSRHGRAGPGQGRGGWAGRPDATVRRWSVVAQNPPSQALPAVAPRPGLSLLYCWSLILSSRWFC